MSEYVLKVTPEELRIISGEVTEKVQRVQSAFESLGIVVEDSQQHWHGDGNDKMRSAYSVRKEEYENIFREIREHIRKLQEIAGVYQEAENANEDLAMDLPGDVII